MMPRKLTKSLKWIGLLAVLGGGVAWFMLRTSAADAPVVFRTGKLDRGPVEQVVTATGQLSAVVTVQVGSQVSGTIQKLFADFNSQVKEGDVIAIIDPTRIKAQLAQSEANYKDAQASMMRARVNAEHARREWDRAKTLGDKQVIGQAEIEELKARHELAQVELISAEARLAQARAQVNTTRVDLERTVIKAPISGTVLQRAVDVGQTVAASLQAPTLFTIAQDLSKMEVRAAVDEADVGKLKEGVEARFTVDAYPGREFVATIYQIRSNPNVQQNVVTYDAILRVDNPDGKLRPGMTANVRIVSERKDDVLRVPNAALRFKPPPEIVIAPEPRGGRRGDGGAPMGPGFGGGEFARRGGDGPGGPPGGFGEGGMRRRGGGGPGGGGERVMARVYKAQGDKVLTIPFRPGISDDQYTEVLFSRGLAPGDEVVVDASGGIFQQAQQQQRQQPGGGMGRGRGPRMF